MANCKALNEYVLLGNSGLRVSPLCLGTMTWGDAWQWGSTKDEARAIFQEYCKQGGNFIDCANKYNEGQSEEWLGDFMEEFQNRDDIVLTTKYSLPMASSSKLALPASADSSVMPGTDATQFFSVNMAGNGIKNLHVSLKHSLKRLRTDYIDILYVHYWDYTMDTTQLMRALNDIVRSGKVLHLGISDAPSWVVAECNAIALAHGWAPFVLGQYRYSLVDRTIERSVLNYSVHRNFPITNWGVLGSGVLTGKYSREGKAEDSKRNTKVSDRDLDIADEVKKVADELGCSCSQAAVAWALRQPGITSPLIGCRTLKQLQDNLGALKVTMSQEQERKLSEASKIELGFPLAFTGTDTASCAWPKKAGKIVL
eukprot:m.173728 g.173728  ORF g.173728 m.173728 type:complete len:369 (-) comp21310_c1_seq1:26-1132(-)